MKTKLFVGLAVVFLALQAFRPERNVSATASFTGKNDIVVLYPPTPAVRQILATACYDCHSNQTRYPWYSNIQPVAWWLASHVNDAKRELNFAEFGTYPRSRQIKKLEAVVDEVGDGTMPLKSYTFIHREAKLTAAQASELSQWAEGLQDQIAGE